MAEPILNTGTSVVDYLKSTGQDSSYSARKALYESSGLKERLGDYSGSMDQNIAFLKQLQTSSGPTIDQQTQQSTPTTQTTPPSDTGQTSATDVLGTLGLSNVPQTPSAEDVLSQVQSDPAYKLYLEGLGQKNKEQITGAEANKAELERQFQVAKTKAEQESALGTQKIEDSYGQRGLFQSGMRQEDVKVFQGSKAEDIKNLTEALAASKLEQDRNTANQLLESDINARGKFLDLASEIIKKATSTQDEARKSAIEQLNKAGYALIGSKLVPTIEAQRLIQTSSDSQFNRDIQTQRLQIAYQNAQTASERNGILNQLRELQLQTQTATTVGQVVNASTGLPVKLTNEAAVQISQYQTLLDRVDYVKTLLDKVSATGAIKGWVLKEGIYVPVVQRELNPQELELMQEMARIANQYVYLVSGKQINEQEYTRLSKAIPNIQATKEANQTVMNNFRSYLESGYNNLLRVNGWTISKQSSGTGTGVGVIGGEASDLSDLDFTF